MQTIYIDVLIILNIYVNYFLLKITAKLTHSPLKTGRCTAAAVYGSIYSLLILAPDMPFPITTAVRTAAAVTIVAAAFGYGGIRSLVMNTTAFFASNFVLAGIVYAVYSWLKPASMHFCNFYFYIDFSLILLVMTTAAAYAGVSVFRRFTDSTPCEDGCYQVLIRYGKRFTSLEGLADTGNSLVDLFTGSPVIICDTADSYRMTGISELSMTTLPKGFRIIPCSTVSAEGVIPVFRPDEVIIKDMRNSRCKSAEVLIGFGKTNGKAIFNPKIL